MGYHNHSSWGYTIYGICLCKVDSNACDNLSGLWLNLKFLVTIMYMFLHKIVVLANYNLPMLIQNNVVFVKHVVGSLLKYVSAPTPILRTEPLWLSSW